MSGARILASAACLAAAAFAPGCGQQQAGPKEPDMTAKTTTRTARQIDWLEWGEAAFRQARQEDKLILLDSGATWCHWCHVMDRVTYEDEEVVELVTSRFIPVRIDRDRMPEVDRHFQRSVALINSRGNGWPLTVLITPRGQTLFKATFLPPRPDVRYGAAIGLVDLLKRLDGTWRAHREDLARAGAGLKATLAERSGEAFAQPGELDERLVEQVHAGIADAYDAAHGGFGTAPKFFSAPAIDLVMARSWQGDAEAARMLARTLEAVARGGVYDHVGGGFHRYSVDARWHVPHFEKMAYDNAAMLRLFANAAAMTAREDFADVARHSRQWVDRVLGGRDGRGFYASQDADVGLDDDGDYFTWTVEEVRAALGDDAETMLIYYAVDAAGDMHERPGRNVLHVPKRPDEVARLLGIQPVRLGAIVASSRGRLLAARQRRTAPRVDRTVFADLNGMMIDAYLTTWQRLGDASARQTALRTLDHLLGTLRDERGVFAHYRGGDGALRRVGLLADQAWMARALVGAYAATAEGKYLAAAETLADYILADLTAADGAFWTAPKPATTGPTAIEPARSWEDSPSRSAASVAAGVLIDLAHVTGRQVLAAAGAKALKSFAGGVQREWGVFLGGYATALEHHLHGPRSVVVVGPSASRETQALAAAARRAYVPGGLVFVLDPARAEPAALLKRLGYPAGERPVGYVCHGKACLAPAASAAELAERIAQLAAAPR